jgi:hypothetical protein
MKSKILGCRTDLILSIWAAERWVEAKIRDIFVYRSKCMGEVVFGE